MGNLTSALVFVMCINVVLAIAQISINQDTNTPQTIYNCQDSQIMQSLDKNGCNGNYSLNLNYADTNLPDASPTTGTGDTNPFTDTFNAIKNWFSNVGGSISKGWGYLKDIVGAPYFFLKNIFGIKYAEITVLVATLWYAITFFLIIAWLKGGDA